MEKRNLTIAEKYNLPRFNPEKEGGLVESYFLIFNLPQKEASLWLKWTFLKPLLNFGEPIGEVWAIYSNKKDPSKNIAIKNTFKLKDIAISYERFYMRFGESELSMGLCKGRVEGKGAKIQWDLQFETGGYYLLHFPIPKMYELPFPKSKLVTPHLKTKFYGWFSINGEKEEVDGESGIQGHNWGSEHSPNWVWAYGSSFDEGMGVFEVISSRIKVKNILLPPVTILFLRCKDDEIFINNPFLSPLIFKIEKGRYFFKFEAITLKHKIEGIVYSSKENLTGINYYGPDGTITHCINSTLANSEIKIFKRGVLGFNMAGILKGEGKSIIEFGTREDTMGIDISLP